MQLMLLCLAVAFMVTGKHQKDTAQAAYRAGKEPPGLAKARMRHESGGNRWKTTSKGTKKPAGQGATRRTLAAHWANACEKSKTKGEDRLRRWQAWYAEQAPERDEQWREKQRAKLAKAHERTERWQSRWTATKQAANPASRRADRDEAWAWDENARRDEQDQGEDEPDHTEVVHPPSVDTGRPEPDVQTKWRAALAAGVDTGVVTSEEWNALPVEQRNQLIAEAKAAGFSTIGHRPDGTATRLHQTPTSQDKHNADASPSAPSGHTHHESGGHTVYRQAVEQLRNHADEVDGYRNALTQLADELAGIGWGAEVHGPLTDMRTHLDQAAGRYRDLADEMEQQGDAVNDSYDAAPWTPDRAALVP